MCFMYYNNIFWYFKFTTSSKVGWQCFISPRKTEIHLLVWKVSWHFSAVLLDSRKHWGDTVTLWMQRGSILHFICIDMDSWVCVGDGEGLTDFHRMWIDVYFFRSEWNRPLHCACLKDPVILQQSCWLWWIQATINTVWLKKHTGEPPQTKLNLPPRQ